MIRIAAGRQGALADRADAAGRRRRSSRCDPADGAILRAGRRLRLRPQQVQPRDPGVAPAGLELQAVHLFGRAGKGLHAGDRDQRRAVRRSTPRRPAAQRWEPKNYDGKFDGPMRLRTALAKSKNMVIDPRPAGDRPAVRAGLHHALRLRPEVHPPYLTMALGAGSVTPLQMARAYAVFANGGYRVDAVLHRQGRRRPRATCCPRRSRASPGEDAERVIDARNAFIMTSLMQDVMRVRHRRRARCRSAATDLAGKTGTTNDHVDAWFCGFSAALVGVAWIGFDQPQDARHQRDRRPSPRCRSGWRTWRRR